MTAHTGQVTSNGARLVYETMGDGPAVVLIHAGIADHTMWNDQWRALAEHYRVVRYDVRGYGDSTNPDGEFSHAEDLTAVLEAAGVGRASFIAASMGGQIALDHILQYPDRAEGLVLVCSGVNTTEPTDQMKAAWGAVGAAFDAGDIAAANEIELKMWVDGPHRTPEQVDATVRARVGEMNGTALRKENPAATARPIEPPIAQRLSEVGVPTLVVVGALDQPPVVESADIFVREIPDARKAVIEGTAHLPSMEKPDEFNALVLDFLHTIHK